MGSQDREMRAEELTSMEAIYGDDFSASLEGTCAVIHVPSGCDDPHITLRVYLPETYPSTTAPVAELHMPHLPDEHDITLRQLEAAWHPGEVVLFEWCQILHERHVAWEERQRAQPVSGLAQTTVAGGGGTAGSEPELVQGTPQGLSVEVEAVLEATHGQGARRRRQSLQDNGQEAQCAHLRGLIVSGQPITERKSTFQAHVAPVSSVPEVEAVMAILLENSAIRRATHNIMAYRFASPGGHCQDFDDDGEAAAGARLLHLLQAANVVGCVVVVSRWFGGVLLGPSRFALINNTARQLLQESGYLAVSSKANSSNTGKDAGSCRKR